MNHIILRKLVILISIVVCFSFSYSQEINYRLAIDAKLKLHPQSGSNTISRLKKGTHITILNNGNKYGEYGGYYAARYKNQTGYINDIYIIGKNIKLDQSINIQDNFSEIALNLVLWSDASLRKKPSAFSDEITRIPKGEILHAIGKRENYYKVKYKDAIGYIYCAWVEETNETKNLNRIHNEKALPPIISIKSIEISKNILLAGDHSRLSIEIINTGPGDAGDVCLSLSCNLKEVIFPIRTIVPVIKAEGGIETVFIDIEGKLDLPTAEAIMRIEITEPYFKIKIQGKQLRFPTQAFKKPELILAQYAVLENQSAHPNNQIDINEMIDLKFAIQNIGQGNAEEVKIEVQNNQNGVMFLGVNKEHEIKRNDPTLASIEAGKFKTISYKYFINSEFSVDEIEFTINVEERHGQFGFSEKKSFPINNQLEELGYIHTVAKTNEQTNNKVTIENIPDFIVDVDIDIPVTGVKQDNTYALIIGNEDYRSKQRGLTSEQNVEYAKNDAIVFAQYCNKTLGIPSNQLRILEDATSAEMNQAIAWLTNLARVENGNAKLILYYSGHGLAHEQTKEAYLIPVDVSGTNLEYAVALNDLYSRLTEYPALQIIVLLDACFSGGSRNEGLLALRGIRIKPKENEIKGNLVIISSSTGEESSSSYVEKKHGFFTYFLLKKLQETKGDTTLDELNSFLKQSVTKASALEGKIQTPQVKVSARLESNWSSLRLR